MFDFDDPNGYESHTVAAVKKLFATELPSRPVCYDVGANIGFYTALFRHLGAKMVIAFEPCSEIIRELQAARPDVTFYIALSNVNETRPVVRGHDWELLSTQKDAGWWCTFQRLDDVIGLPPPNLIKIDIDGYESRMLEGSRRTLEHARPILVIELAETAHEHHGEDVRDAIRTLHSCGYKLYHEDTNECFGLDPDEIVRVRVPKGGSINVIARPTRSALPSGR